MQRQKTLNIPMFLLSGFAIGCVVALGMNVASPMLERAIGSQLPHPKP